MVYLYTQDLCLLKNPGRNRLSNKLLSNTIIHETFYNTASKTYSWMSEICSARTKLSKPLRKHQSKVVNSIIWLSFVSLREETKKSRVLVYLVFFFCHNLYHWFAFFSLFCQFSIIGQTREKVIFNTQKWKTQHHLNVCKRKQKKIPYFSENKTWFDERNIVFIAWFKPFPKITLFFIYGSDECATL